jgi:WD40 repeat protein
MELYDVRKILGEGGFGVVYKVYHRGWGISVAVKSPRMQLLHRKGWKRNFEHECETWVHLSDHPNTVRCHYVRSLGGVPRIFTEFVNGMDLWHAIDKKSLYAGNHREALDRMLDIAIQFCWGLHHAHSEGVVHQDVKPSNVLVGTDGTVKVTDFGLARVQIPDPADSPSSGGEGTRIARGPKGGTPVYSSPDLDRFDEVTPRADIWSWGVSIIEMFAGEIFWKEGNRAPEVLANLLSNGARYDVVPPMPDGLINLLERCFRFDPEDRPASMLVVADALKEVYLQSTGKVFDRQEPHVEGISSAVLNNRAVSLLDLGKDQESIDLWSEAEAYDPTHLATAYNHSLFQWRRGEETDAAVLKKQRALCFDHEENWLPRYFLARLYMETGDCGSALQVLETISSDEYLRDVSFAQALARDYKEQDTRLVKEYVAHSSSVTATDLSFDGVRAVTGCSRGKIRVWKTMEGECTATLLGHDAAVNSLCFGGNETFIISGSADENVRIWGADTGMCRHTLRGHKGAVHSVAISGDGSLALSGSSDERIRLWHVESGECLFTLEGHEGPVNAVALSPNGDYGLSGGEDGLLKLWKMSTGECIHTGEQHAKGITAISVSEQHPLALTASSSEVSLWNMKRKVKERIFKGHKSSVLSVCLGEEGKLALSATPGGTIKIWNVKTGQCLRSLRGRTPLSLSSDGRFAISQGKRGNIKIWALGRYGRALTAPYYICRSDNGIAL